MDKGETYSGTFVYEVPAEIQNFAIILCDGEPIYPSKCDGYCEPRNRILKFGGASEQAEMTGAGTEMVPAPVCTIFPIDITKFYDII